MCSELEKLEDRELVAKFRATGDDRYFAALFNRYQKWVYSICCAVFENGATAEDLLQETFARAYEKIASFNERESKSDFRAWLSTICKHACLDELRKVQIRAEYEAETKASGRIRGSGQLAGGRVRVAGSDYDPQEVAAIFQQLNEELKKLPEEKRICWLLFHVDGYSYKEIAEKMGLGPEQVKINMQAVNRHLKRRFQ